MAGSAAVPVQARESHHCPRKSPSLGVPLGAAPETGTEPDGTEGWDEPTQDKWPSWMPEDGLGQQEGSCEPTRDQTSSRSQGLPGSVAAREPLQCSRTVGATATGGAQDALRDQGTGVGGPGKKRLALHQGHGCGQVGRAGKDS